MIYFIRGDRLRKDMSTEEEIREVYEGDIGAMSRVVASKGMNGTTGLYSGMGNDGYSITTLVPRRDEILEIGEMIRIAELDSNTNPAASAALRGTAINGY
jgi:hypothetical protein